MCKAYKNPISKFDVRQKNYDNIKNKSFLPQEVVQCELWT
jgi:hypothetical protein